MLRTRLAELPVLPAVVIRLMALKPRDPNHFEQVIEIAGDDPVLVMRVIRAANSAMSAPIEPIDTMHAAVTRLGANATVDLATSLGMSDALAPRTTARHSLWVHSVDVAVTMRDIVEILRLPGIDPSRAHLLGLVHDIGRFLFVDDHADVPVEVGDESLLEEHRRYGIDHAELGLAICARWDIPQSIASFVRRHHSAVAPVWGDDDVEEQLIAICHFADALSALIAGEPEWDALTIPERALRIGEHCMEGRASRVPLPPMVLARRTHEWAERAAMTREALGLSV